MRGGSGYRSGQTTIFWIAGLAFIVLVGAGLIWFGFEVGKENRRPAVDQPSPTVLAAVSPLLPTATMTPVPTVTPIPQFVSPQPTPLPTATPLPAATLLPTDTPSPDTPVPATEASALPKVVAGENGTNVRSGPGTNFDKLGYLNPGTEAKIIGLYADWWQIEYDSAPGWVYSGVVTASNTDGIPEVQPPSSPTPRPATPVTTSPPQPTQPPQPVDYHGVVPDGFQVEGAPGPYAKAADIRFHIWLTNKTGSPVEYEALGIYVEETGDFQKSFTYSEFPVGKQFYHDDHINQFTLESGTYNLWLTLCFYGGECYKLLEPVVVTIQ